VSDDHARIRAMLASPKEYLPPVHVRGLAPEFFADLKALLEERDRLIYEVAGLKESVASWRNGAMDTLDALHEAGTTQAEHGAPRQRIRVLSDKALNAWPRELAERLEAAGRAVIAREYMSQKLLDNPDYPAAKELRDALDAVTKARAEGRVPGIHARAGGFLPTPLYLAARAWLDWLDAEAGRGAIPSLVGIFKPGGGPFEPEAVKALRKAVRDFEHGRVPGREA
jgi:hypothetical protein